MNPGKRAIFAGLAAGILFAVVLFISGCASVPPHAAVTGRSRPLSAIAVSQCGLAVALFIQLDAAHLFRADPRQSDLFTAVNGHMKQTTAAPMKWDDAYELAGRAVLSSHVVLPCPDWPGV